ncbi:DHS-like NAD/FAD-binding domain-containing protein, partial [Xylariales sp. AK1849]
APIKTHRLINDLSKSGQLFRNYTQNIDDLERKTGLSTDLNRGPGIRRYNPSAKLTYAAIMDQGVECVQLYGTLRKLRCLRCGARCDWDGDEIEATTGAGKLPDCPSWFEHSLRRSATGLCRLQPGLLRPDIVLYGEDDPRSDAISAVLRYDLRCKVDFLLIMGTSLSVRGIEELVKSFSNIAHQIGGTVVFINRTTPYPHIWRRTLDFWVEWDCESWARDLDK